MRQVVSAQASLLAKAEFTISEQAIWLLKSSSLPPPPFFFLFPFLAQSCVYHGCWCRIGQLQTSYPTSLVTVESMQYVSVVSEVMIPR